MHFISLEFLMFVAAVWVLFWLSPTRFRMHVLLAASYFFYGAWSIPYIGLVVAATSVAYVCARFVAASDNVAVRKCWLMAGLLSNLSVLMCFKYANFFFDAHHSLMGMFGLTIPTFHSSLLLPIGISFYTFEAISYLIDVYRGRPQAPNWLAYNFYIMFFPHLVAGPIVRFDRFSAQYIDGIERPDWKRIKRAFSLIVAGVAMKLIVSDAAARLFHFIPINNGMPTLNALMAAAAFGAEIYFDFQGYTQIARGVALLFNLELPANFNDPGAATNIADFWTRWNITLSRWLYDYVYVPMGGGRRALPKRMIGAFVTMLIAGVWHGAGWNFIFMGAYFGVLVALYHLFRTGVMKLPPAMKKFRSTSKLYAWASWIVTQYLILPAIVLFNPDLTKDLVLIKSIVPLNTVFGEALALMHITYAPLIAALSFMVAVTYCQRFFITAYGKFGHFVPHWVKVQAVTVVVVTCVVLECQQTDASFMYAQF